MEKLDLSVNTRVEVYNNNIGFKSTVQDIRADGYVISIPTVNGEYLSIDIGEELELMVYADKGCVYSFNSKGIGRTIENKIPMYILSKPYNVNKIQRRDFVRVDTVQVIGYQKYTDDNGKYKEGLLLDLSGGGMRLKISEKLNYREKIKIRLKDDLNQLLVEGEIVRIQKTDDSRYIYGISFTEIDNITRERVIKNVFAIMRKQREIT